MAVDIIMPHMGESVVEGTVVSWLKQAGETVEQDEPLVEVETDKVNVEIPAPSAGVLVEILAHEGDTVEVDGKLGVIGEAGQAAVQKPAPKAPTAAPKKPAPRTAKPAPQPRPAPKTEKAAPASKPTPPPTPQGRRVVPPEIRPAASIESTPTQVPDELGSFGVHASPAVRRFARQMGVDLRQVAGTGRMGRITRADVQGYLDRPQAEAPAPPGEEAAPEPEAAKERYPDVDEELVPLTPMRRAIAEHMVRSKREAPHVTTVAEVDVTEVDALRNQWKKEYEAQGVKLTYMAFILNAVGRALRDHPELNASWTDDGILVKYRINLGVAVEVDEGLIVPVIRDADRMTMLELAAAIRSVAEKARAGKVSLADLQGGTFTITNPGVLGAVISTPVIHQPQAAILATGRIADVPAVVDGKIVVRKRMFMSLSYDHRIVDGATAVRFLQRIRGILEQADFEA